MNIVWAISQLDYQISNGFVTSAYWSCLAKDEKFSKRITGVCSWGKETPKISYADLTENIVLGWIWDSEVDKNNIENMLKQQIEMLNTPVTASGLPWAK
jgi:hypothetical protein